MDELAQKLAAMRNGVAPPWSEVRRQRVLAGVFVLRRRQGIRRASALAGSAVLAVCGLVYLGVREPAETPTARVVTPSVQPSGVSDSNVAIDTNLALALWGTRLLAGERALLADGSKVQVAAGGGELLVDGNQPDAVELRLVSGSAHFEVVPNAQRRFSVVSGSVSVFVLGTAFDVERTADRVRVAVEHGRVRVANAAGEALVEAGESRWFEQDSPVTPTTAGPRAKPRASRAPAAPPARDETPQLDWRSLHNGGDYERAYQLLAQGAPVGDEAEALMDAADAARLSNHPDVAANYLAQVLREHRRSPSTPLAAFTLGRLLLERLARPVEAAEAFAAAHDFAPHGSLAQDALAREVEAWSKAGRSEEAYRRASLFVQTYPNSRRLAAVKQYGGLRAPSRP